MYFRCFHGGLLIFLLGGQQENASSIKLLHFCIAFLGLRQAFSHFRKIDIIKIYNRPLKIFYWLFSKSKILFLIYREDLKKQEGCGVVAHERHTEPRVTIEWLITKSRSFSNLPASSDLNGRNFTKLILTSLVTLTEFNQSVTKFVNKFEKKFQKLRFQRFSWKVLGINYFDPLVLKLISNLFIAKQVWTSILLPFRFRKSGRVWCGGARETHWPTWSDFNQNQGVSRISPLF